MIATVAVGPTPVQELGGLAPPPPPTGRRARRRWARLGRLASYAATVLLIATVNFLLPRALPGDPIDALVDTGSPTQVPDERLRAELADHYGLDRPLGEQYLRYLGGLARLDLGTSIRYNQPVAGLLADRLPWTLLLVATAMALAVAIGWLAGIWSGWRRDRPADRRLLALFVGLKSIPVFFVGSLAVFVFSVRLGWFPLSGTRTPFSTLGPVERVVDVAHHLALPAVVLALEFVASQYLVMRAGMVGELGAGYLLGGRAKGLSERRLKYHYAARNALLPVVTLTAVHLSFAVTHSVLVESVFAYQGVGRLMFEAVSFRDYPALQGCFLVLALAVVTANAAADALVARLDPRVGAP